MNPLLLKLQAYEAWVAKNPDIVSDFETTTKWASLIFMGRLSKSSVTSELVYTLSNLVVFYHDGIISKHSARYSKPKIKNEDKRQAVQRIKILLTTIEHSEIFIELLSQRIKGSRGKWISVLLIQLIKSIGRYYLLYHTKENIVIMPPIPAFNRKSLKMPPKNEENAKPGIEEVSKYQLKRSGRFIRKVEGAPPFMYRNSEIFKKSVKPKIQQKLLIAECLYIGKPILHLIALFKTKNENCWKPYMLALFIDLFSITTFYRQRNHLIHEQYLEMRRRCLRFLLYFLRSPFYEQYTSAYMRSILNTLGKFRLLAFLAKAIEDYIQYFQQIYFYLWSV